MEATDSLVTAKKHEDHRRVFVGSDDDVTLKPSYSAHFDLKTGSTLTSWLPTHINYSYTLISD